MFWITPIYCQSLTEEKCMLVKSLVPDPPLMYLIRTTFA